MLKAHEVQTSFDETFRYAHLGTLHMGTPSGFRIPRTFHGERGETTECLPCYMYALACGDTATSETVDNHAEQNLEDAPRGSVQTRRDQCEAR